MLLAHGLPKLSRYAELSSTFPDPIGLGSHFSLLLALFAEVACAGLLALGLFTRLAALNLIVTMAVAFFIVHGADPFQKKELAFVYFGMFAALFFTGPGAYAFQNFFKISAGRWQWLLR